MQNTVAVMEEPKIQEIEQENSKRRGRRDGTRRVTVRSCVTEIMCLGRDEHVCLT